jgi:hypothetical protein
VGPYHTIDRVIGLVFSHRDAAANAGTRFSRQLNVFHFEDTVLARFVLL